MKTSVSSCKGLLSQEKVEANLKHAGKVTDDVTVCMNRTLSDTLYHEDS